MTIELRPLAPFGVEVVGMRLWEAADANLVQELTQAWSAHGLLIFRRQALSEDELVAFSSQFGEAAIIVREDWQSQNRPEVTHISNMKNYHGRSIGGLGVGELDWHTDQSYMVQPATGSILYMVEMPKEAPTTYWANLQLAYAGLDVSMQERVRNFDVIYDYLVRQSRYDDEPKMSTTLRRSTPPVSHPLVNRHPTSGSEALYLDPTTAAGIDGMGDVEGQSLLADLCQHATQPEFVYAHQWQIGDVVMWDNGFLMHKRDAFDPDKNRLLKRTTLRLPPDRHIVPTGKTVEF